MGLPFVTTLHGRLDLPEYSTAFGSFPNVPVVSISDNQRLPVPDLNWAGTIHHGMPINLLRPMPTNTSAPYLAFLGRVAPEKRVDRAIEIAGGCGMTLKIAAKIDIADKKYFDRDISHLFALPHVDYIGEINDAQKTGFLSDATALLLPIDWEEPFGLVMIEAMACGCPVIAYRRGSVPEVIEDGVTGFIVDDIAGAIEACGKLHLIDRRRVRARFEERFSSRRMAQDYVAVYERLIARQGFMPSSVMPSLHNEELLALAAGQ
jgi:glycosyltransferase involved in cell wall biosynthesis